MKFTVIGCSPAWPNPGGAHSGYVLEHALESPARRLRAGRPGASAGGGRLAARRCDRDHPFPSRPLGRSRPVGVGRDVPGGRRGDRRAPGALGACRRARCAGAVREPVRVPGHVRPGVHRQRVRRRNEPFTAAGFEVTPFRLPHYTLETYGFRLSGGRVDDRLLGRQRPERAARRPRTRLGSVRLRGNPRPRRRRRPAARTSQRRGGDRGGRRGRCEALLLTHRPAELAVPPGVERAYDGLELEVVSGSEVCAPCASER